MNTKNSEQTINKKMLATMTSKGQVTFPKAIRDKLNLESDDKIEFTLTDERQLLIIPKTVSVKNSKAYCQSH